MKLTADRELFWDAFQAVMGAVPAKTPKDILLTVQLKAKGENVELSATDLDIGIKTTIQNIKIEEEGTINLLASKMSQVLKKSMDDIITIEETSEKIKIKSGKNRFNLLNTDPEDFPVIDDFPSENNINIKADVLKELINKTVFSTSKDTSRWALNGVLFNLEGNSLEAVATDSKRLAYFSCEVENKENFNTSIIIPARSLMEVNKSLEGKSDTVQMALTDKKVFFKTTRSCLVTRLVDGKFPPYKQVIPENLDAYHKISVSRISLSNAIDQASIFISESSLAIKMELEESELHLRSRSPEAGDSEISIKIDEPIDKKFTIGFNPHYVMEYLKVVPQETVEFMFKDSKSMGVFVGKGDTNYKYLIMPVSLEF